MVIGRDFILDHLDFYPNVEAFLVVQCWCCTSTLTITLSKIVAYETLKFLLKVVTTLVQRGSFFYTAYPQMETIPASIGSRDGVHPGPVATQWQR